MAKGSKRRRKRKPPVSLGMELTENLPLPYTHYPGHYGVFIGFSEDARSQVYLCSCAREKVKNLFDLRLSQCGGNIEKANAYPIHNRVFPVSIETVITSNQSIPMYESILFRDNLCHLCNQVRPSVRWCSEIYGTLFVQHYGWYIKQEFLGMGMHHTFHSDFLSDLTPSHLVDMMRNYTKASNASHAAFEDHRKTVSFTRKMSEEEKESSFRLWKRFKKLEKVHQKKLREFNKEVENRVRIKFKKKKIGERWLKETMLSQLVTELFPEHTVMRHHRPDWLGGLELDIYIPELSLGIEYQGEQHYKPIEVWGGQKALAELQERDRRKAQLCANNSINLLYVKYDEPLSEEHIIASISSVIRG